jgi:hypothetical protein
MAPRRGKTLAILVITTIAAMMAFPHLVLAQPWSPQTVDSSGDVGQYTSLALDSSNRPHISYYDVTNRDLRYARWTGSAWSIQTVDWNGDVGQYSSIALDASGYPHIAYYDSTNKDLKYARWTGSGWSIQTVDSNHDVGKYCSLALDSSGYPHISYYDASSYDLKYAKFTGSAWQIETVDSTGTTGQYTSIALDSSGRPHISYYYVSAEDLKYARWTGSEWLIQTVDSTGGVGQYTSIAVDGSNHPHISYYDFSNTALKYACDKNGDGDFLDLGEVVTVDDAVVVGEYSSLALNSSGYPRISYYDSGNDDLKYAYWTGTTATGWSVHTLACAGNVGKYTSLAVDTNGCLHVSYYDETNSDLKYIYGVEPQWSIERVDEAHDVGMDTSIALDSNNYPRISYYDSTYYDLKYARWTGIAWQIQTVDSTGGVGRYSSIAVDSSNRPHISYYDASNTALKYACDKNGDGDFSDTGEVVTVDSAGGQYTSIALDSSGYPHISYYTGDLKYARWTGSSWLTEIVDSSGTVGGYTSIALDSGGNPHISYYDLTNKDLKYAARIAGSWAVQTVDGDGDVGEYTSLALDSSGYPRITYYDVTNQRLKYARWTGTAWSIQTVDPSTGVGEYSSMALDSGNRPHVSYYDSTNGDLKYACDRNNDGDFLDSDEIITLDCSGIIGRYTSIAMDTSNRPHISYYDGSNHDLKYARYLGVTVPTISFSPSSFSFSATQGGANPPSQTLHIWNSGGGTLSWSVSDDATWLSLSPTSGSSAGETDTVTVSVGISGMVAGTYSAIITISAPGATNTPQTVPVSLVISPSACVDNPPVGVGLASISDKLILAYGYKYGEGTGGWTIYNPAWATSHPDWNTLTTLFRGRGYWIKVSQACNLVYGGNTYQLDPGWNLIGWLGCQ